MELFDYVIQFISSDSGPVTIFLVMVCCGLGLPLNGDLIMLLLGSMAGLGKIDYPMLLILCPTGIFVGDTITYLISRELRMRVFRLWPFYQIATPDRIYKAIKFSKKYGPKVLFLARFAPGTRFITIVITGVFRVPLSSFLSMNFLGLFLFCPIWISLGYYFISSLAEAKSKALPLLVIFFIIILSGFGIYYLNKSNRNKTRDQC